MAGPSCVRSEKCRGKHDANVVWLKANLYARTWIWYMLPVILAIILFFLLPKEEEYISLVLLAIVAVVAVLQALYGVVRGWFVGSCPSPCARGASVGGSPTAVPGCPKCLPKRPPKDPDDWYSKTAKAERSAVRRVTAAATQRAALRACPHAAPFEPSDTPDVAPGVAPAPDLAGYDYEKCIAQGFDVAFCTTTPLPRDGAGWCECPVQPNGQEQMGTVDPSVPGGCRCPKPALPRLQS